MYLSCAFLLVALTTSAFFTDCAANADASSMLQMPDQRRQPCNAMASSPPDLMDIMQGDTVTDLFSSMREKTVTGPKTVTVSGQEVTAIRFTTAPEKVEHNGVTLQLETPDLDDCIVAFTFTGDGTVAFEFKGCQPDDFLITIPKQSTSQQLELLQVTNGNSCTFCNQSNADGTHDITLPVAQNSSTVTCQGQSSPLGSMSDFQASCSSVGIVNPDFESAESSAGAQYEFKYVNRIKWDKSQNDDAKKDMSFNGWETIGDVVVIKTNKNPWGKITASNGTWLLGLQRSGSSVTQSVEFEQGKCYALTVSVAQRQNNPRLRYYKEGKVNPKNATLTMSVGTDMLSNLELHQNNLKWDLMNPHTKVFVATAAIMNITFENIVPDGVPTDQTVFIDNIKVSKTDDEVCDVQE